MLDIKLQIINKNGTIINISPTNIEFKITRNKTAGCLKFSYFTNKYVIDNGDSVYLSINKKDIFSGYIFSIIQNNETINIISFDRTKFLMFKDTKTYNYTEISSAISSMLLQKGITDTKIDYTGVYIDNIIFKDKTYFNMIYTFIKYIKDTNGDDYSIYSIGKDIFFKNKVNCIINTKITCDTNILNYDLSSDISRDTYNYFKIIRQNKKKGIYDVFIKENKELQKKYGTLQYFKAVSDKLTAGQVTSMLNTLYDQKYMSLLTLYVRVIGSEQFFVGHIVNVNIKKCNINANFLIDEVKHIINGNIYICDMKLSFI